MVEVSVLVLVAILAATVVGSCLLARRLRLRACAVTPLPLLVLAALGLAIPAATEGGRILAVDVSFSTGVPDPDLETVGRSAGLSPGVTRVLLFGERTVVLSSGGGAWPAVGAAVARAGRGASDLGGALRTALPLAGAGSEVIVATDGRASQSGVRAAAIALRARGARIRLHTHGRFLGGDVRVDMLSVPSRLRAGEVGPVLVRVRGPRGLSVDVELRVDGGLSETRSVVVSAAGTAGLRFVLDDLAPGWHEVEVRVRPSPGDPAPANDRQSTGVVVGGGRRALLANASGAAAELRRRGFTVEEAPPDAAGRLRDYDLIVLRDVPAADLVDGGSELAAYVRGGGGLLLLGGPASFGPGGYAGRPVEGVLPLRSEAGDERLLVVLLLDRSGTMSEPFSPGGPAKLEAACSAARRLLAVLPPHADFLLVPFSEAVDGRPGFHSLETASGRAGAAAAIDAVADAHGGTRLLDPLDLARRAIAGRSGRSLVLLLTDGRAEEEEPERIVAGAEGVRRAGGRLFAVAVGEDADLSLLDRLAGPEGPAARVGEAGGLGDAFLAALLAVEGEDKVRTGRFPVVPGPGAESPVRAPPSEIEGYVRTFPAAGAEVWLRTAGGDPLAAGGRFGLGTAVAVATDPLGPWAGSWSGSGVLGDLADRAARPAGLSGPRVTASRDSDRTRLEVRVDSAEPSLAARLDGPGGARDLELRVVGRGLYAVELPAAAPGAYRLAVRSGGQVLDGGFGLPWAPEFGESGVDPEGIAGLRAALGEGPAPERGGRDVSTFFALAALMLFLVDRILKMRGSVRR